MTQEIQKLLTWNKQRKRSSLRVNVKKRLAKMKRVNSNSTSTPDPILQTGHVVKDKWQVVEKIGQGAFGEVYHCTDLKGTKPVALKLVSNERGANIKYMLKLETTVLKEIQSINYFPKFVGFGKTERFDYLVMELLGPSLSELRKKQQSRKFSLSTMLRLGKMMLKCIQSLHKAGFLHCDIKPSNFTIGFGAEYKHQVYMLDFGLVRQYVLKGGKVRNPRPRISFQGTPRYASLQVLQGQEAGRQDDLMSLFYSLYELSFKELPWKNVKEVKEVAQLKEQFNHQDMVKEFPDEFKDFYEHITELGYFDEPNYDFLSAIFDCCIKRRGVKETDSFDFDEADNLKVCNSSPESSQSASDMHIMEDMFENCETNAI